MTPPGSFDPEASMSTFRARRTQPAAPDGRRGSGGSDRAHERRGSTPPFGTRRGDRVGYAINLPADLARELDDHVNEYLEGEMSHGQIAVRAIRTEWRDLLTQLRPAPPSRRTGEVRRSTRFGTGEGNGKRTFFYVSPDEADEIDAIRARLGGIDLDELHRWTLDRFLRG